MKILAIGGGGREHALVWKLKQSRRVEKIWCAPGNAGIGLDAECVATHTADVPGLIALARKIAPDLTLIGPELPLVQGIGDAFREQGWPIIGPSKEAAQLEGSKIFAKEFLQRHGIPTAEMYGAYDSPGDAYGALCAVDWPVVIKADGLCAGKGVFLAPNPDAATDFIERLMERNELGEGARRLLIEEALEGQELSFIVLTDGERYAEMVPTRDHKRVFDGDLGPNTGGMGAYSSDDLLPPSLRGVIISQVVAPTMAGLAADGIRYQGFLYFGLMLTKAGPKVLEFNCRLGDPETQAIVTRMDFDFAQVLADVAAGHLQPEKLNWKPGASACVVLTSGGYPGKFEINEEIRGLTSLLNNSGVVVFHSATRKKPASPALFTAGGRVLGVTASGTSLDEALTKVYGAIANVHFDGVHFRKDIGATGARALGAGD